MGIALLTDKYELTMLQAALEHKTSDRNCVFEVFTRRLPAWRRYGVVAGTGRLLEALADFKFQDEDLSYLEREGTLNQQTLSYLENYRFSGNIRGYGEGEVYFPQSPLLVVEATFAEAVLLETLILSILNFDSAVASAASRMTAAAGNRPCLEMGSRRAHEYGAVAAARAAAIAGFHGTSNLEAGRVYGIPAIGTSAHAFTLLHDSEEEAFTAQVAALGVNTTLLVDTYDVTEGVNTAIRVAGTNLGAVRLDSGDLGVQADEVRKQLDALGAKNTLITVTSDLDEHAIAALAAAPVDSYGVGTSLVTGSGAPTSSMVYKLVSRENAAGQMEPVAKASKSKASLGGRKVAARQLDSSGHAEAELIAIGDRLATEQWLADHDNYRPLHIDMVTDGKIDTSLTGIQGVQLATERHAAARSELPRYALRLSTGDAAIPTHIEEL
ncbi:nicotinate phosphoribosyltransferase [Jonesiaceae bacterium BS-20]|uniref:Nicotinate phosphoribosyltransferase n=1 Tax=Jonesiaceae bacterium BS-20 TaxID=3120821 RepID=A0AAU7DYJ4_9MICO